MTPTTCDIFDVYNVDARLFKQSKGQLQISASSLTFEIKSLFTNKNNNQRASEPIVWPLTGIRRYGYHKNIFLFECGRRCPNGEGLYAFMTNKARRLNDSVHKAIIDSTTQPCNLQIPREANRNGKKLLTKINSILTTDTILTTDAESMNYTSLNDGSSSNYVGTTATERTTSYDENNTMTDNTIYYRMLGAGNQNPSGLQEHPTEARSSYYVNDDIVRLPVNLNFLNSNDTEYNNYVNSDLIDPRILAITKKFTKHLSEHKANNRVGQATSSEYYVPTLNYIVPEKMIKPTTGTAMNEEGDGEVNYVKQGRLEMIADGANVTKARVGGTKERVEAIDYVVIDKDKTPAAQFSQKQVDNRRTEYFHFPKH